jgi:4-hydroxy-L-threonine phosphate dehydrogenase PdxA
MTRWIGITLGDVTGIGPEVTLKALAADAADDDTRYLLIGDEAGAPPAEPRNWDSICR